MRNFLKQYFLSILFLLLIAISLWKFPVVTTVLGIIFLFISLVISISSIFKKHKQSENSRFKILKEILVLTLAILLAIVLGGMAGMYTSPTLWHHCRHPLCAGSEFCSWVYRPLGNREDYLKERKAIFAALIGGNRRKIKPLIIKMDEQVLRITCPSIV